MQFCYTADERELLAFARQSIRGHLPLDRLRSPTSDVRSWVALARDGWLHACLGPDTGALPLTTLAGLAREAGAVAAAPEFVHNAWVIPRLCASISDTAQATQWLETHLARPGYVGGLRDGGLPVRDSTIDFGAHPGFDRYELSADRAQLTRQDSNTSDVDPVAGLSIGAARVRAGASPRVTAALDLSVTETELIDVGAAVLRCAALVGAADELLARTVAYVKEREQFGRPLGQFQAVKHLCADVYAEVQVSWLAVLYAALCWSDDPTALPSARAQASAAAWSAARVGAQLHGGMGFTWESDVHWLLKTVLDGQLCTPSGSAAAQEAGERVLETV